MKTLLTAAISLLAASAPSCLAGGPPLDFYSTQPAWEAATSNQSLVATFSESLWPTNQVLVGDWPLNGVTYRGLAGTSGGLGSPPLANIFIIDPSPLSGPALTANGDEDIDMTLSPARLAMGFDIAVNTFGPVLITVFDPAGEMLGQTQIAPGTVGFLGVVSPTPIGKVNFRSVLGALQNSLADNVRLADRACAADFNADGFLDPDDLADFITCFFLDIQFPGTCPAADFNADGFRDPDDLSDFITAFFLGC